jgi:hypothetical protein
MGFSGPLIRDRGAVALEHRAGPPTGQAHQIGLASTFSKPQVRKGMAEQVHVEAIDAGLAASATEELRDARGGDAALLADPEPFQVGVRMPGPGP